LSNAKPFKHIVTIDFETRWSKADYTLSKMTTEEYIRDPRFKVFGACLHEYGSDEPPRWYNGDDLHTALAQHDWTQTAILAHNAQFDVSILEWKYDCHPVFILDTLSMARALRGTEAGNSLAQLAQEFDLPPKGNAVHNTDGLEELTPEIEAELAEYCAHDVMLCEEIFHRLSAGYPAKELRLIDLTLKMYTQPRLLLDGTMLTKAIDEERTQREALLTNLGITDADLASNPKFAQLLEAVGVPAPRKISKTTGEETLALAKNDAMFQAIMNGENEAAALLCEARLKVKSTTERTRAQRFLDISKRGPLPVPLSYYGATTGRWTASKGSAINMQNLKRGSFLRKAILAPMGHTIVVGDLSQIEPRVLAWLSDYEDMLDIFRSGADPYAAFGAQMFNIPGMTKNSHPELRQSAKSALLGCFGPDTSVLTNRGWVPIVRVQATDTVWDGKGWVCHQGVVPQGEKEVLTALGISATSDHEILTEHGWAEWCAVLANPSLLKSALSLGNSPAWVGSTEVKISNPSCAVLADGKALLTETTFGTEGVRDATDVQNGSPSKHVGNGKGITPFAPTATIANGFSTGLAQSLSAAQTQIAQSIQTMAGAASRYTRHGLQIVSSFFDTLSPSMAGMCPSYSLIGQTTAKATNPATYGLLRAASTCPTSGAYPQEGLKNSSSASLPLKQRMQTYDIAFAGPRNRYTILTDAGPLIVHNCGYGLGWASFASQLMVGFLGAPPIRYKMAFGKQLGVNKKFVGDFVSWRETETRLLDIPHTCTMEELVNHAVSAKKIIDTYRATAYPVVGLWALCTKLLVDCLVEGKEYTYKCLTFRKGEIELPNGMKIRYPNLRKDEDGNWVYGKDATKLYAGKITNNITQALARIVMTDGMLRVSKRYPVVGTVHDELIALAPEDEAQEALDWVLEQMTMEPSYMPGIPLAADGGTSLRYGDAKQ